MGTIVSLIVEKKEAVIKLKEEINALELVRLLLYKSKGKTHVFETESEMKNAMLNNYNSFDTFIVKAKL